MAEIDHIRNFCIIAHVDHGKTTLSDRLLEQTRTVQQREMKEQLLDSMDLERERGITIKSHPVSMIYEHEGKEYLLNLIDTPGHVDFSYEVSRSLAACEGALLLIDAAQGIEAQTVANANLAMAQDLEIIPVINKVDLPSANPEAIEHQIEEILALPREDTIRASGKSGIGIQDILSAVVNRLPPPRWAIFPQARVLVFDATYDAFKGVICYIRIFSGEIKKNDEIVFMGSGTKTTVKEIGRFSPQMISEKSMTAGRTGYLVTAIKELSQIKIGDTITLTSEPAKEPLPGYKEVRPMVFSGVYPLDTNDYTKLKTGVAKLQMNDAALTFQAESSAALGFGFRCGFLGLLHMEIVQERLRREYDLDIISTYPSVVYKVTKSDGSIINVDNPLFLPDPGEIEQVEEPTIRATIHTPNGCIGDILALVSEKRGFCDHTETVDADRVMLVCTLPLNEILIDFNDRLKSITKGYGSMDYELGDYQPGDLVRLDILVNSEPVDAFASIVHRDKAASRGRALCERLKEILPQQMFKVAIQASVGSNIVARESLSALRKDVTAKCYGGDITRKRKLLEKQKEGKKRMKQIGKVAIPQDAFVKVLKTS
ncbi:translation elongation factor 4 [Rubellicoccus peritrichatus]|uniref:Elongation factor 4 n=1 Tax=Rubellicoccus peritrichatus TaxID=3080537 RepID=A0AAQ3LAC7_9BACT|nr:translation elongation factor 4 [Puniceicoccus sp. CR14]WOO40884.1 translation elongation factor 4 [Puniceicoccus sp. CR14]